MSGWMWLALAVAGGLGAIARFEVDAWVARVRTHRAQRGPGVAQGGPGVAERRLAGVPLGTLAVNTSACLLLGLLTGALSGGGSTPQQGLWLTVLGTGFCGGYSTFSTACVESARLVLAGRLLAGFGLAVVMTLAGQLAAMLGMLIAS